jgi:hypothetical protein
MLVADVALIAFPVTFPFKFAVIKLVHEGAAVEPLLCSTEPDAPFTKSAVVFAALW